MQALRKDWARRERQLVSHMFGKCFRKFFSYSVLKQHHSAANSHVNLANRDDIRDFVSPALTSFLAFVTPYHKTIRNQSVSRSDASLPLLKVETPQPLASLAGATHGGSGAASSP